MHYFHFKGSELYAEEIPVKKLAEKFGTPLYVYSRKTIERHINAYRQAFKGLKHIICYAVKANSNLSVLRLLGGMGCGADVISGGELFRALRAGIKPERIVYAGVGKTEEEIRYALNSGILMFNVESSEELKEINRIAGLMKKKAPVALRVNPDIDAKTHPYISTGLKKHKFGIPMEEALENYLLARELKNIDIKGIHKHIGSQITEVRPFIDALKSILSLAGELESRGIKIKYIDIGGGLGIPYKEEEPPHPSELAKEVKKLLKEKDLTIIIEPGRSIVGNAGILVTKVLYNKRTKDKNFVIVDAGMNDLIRPTLYGAYHEIVPVERKSREKVIADIVGPICESGDFFARDREIEVTSQGELLAIMSAGAYGFSMSSNYNSRPRAAEVMVNGKKAVLIRKRETYRDLIRGEI
ncbi:MAG: diaminopimelate decarboxylase [Thermodesulfovibrionales bacterium]|nr:diaminopimelate decarboxylase [Thermodesulfovibrionales bacterium]